MNTVLAKQIENISHSQRICTFDHIKKHKFETQPHLLYQLANEIVHFLPGPNYPNPLDYWNEIDYIHGLDIGCIPLVVMLSYQLNIPTLLIHPIVKPYHLGTQPNPKGKRVQLIEEVLTEELAILRTLIDLESDGYIINPTLFCVLDQEEGGREYLNKLGYQVKALYTKTELENLYK